MKQSIDIHYDNESITITISNKRFYDSGGKVEFVGVFQELLEELGYDVISRAVY